MQTVKIMDSDILKMLKSVLWGMHIDGLKDTVFDEAQKHSLIALPIPCLTMLSLSAEIKEKWKKCIFQQMAYYEQYTYNESRLHISVPYVILKGSSAAQYYPHPEYRAMGDIDIMTKREDFEQAYQDLLADGYQVISSDEREVGLVKNGVMVELHRFFSSLNDVVAAKYLDDLIINNITSSHVLIDSVNGLVLLEHISQHLESGIGLRQIIDWMLFVDQCLPDEKWPEFRSMAETIKLEQLAIVVTRMCEIYIELPHREWCKNADMDLCAQLMDYVLSCGNFGIKRSEDSDIIEKVFTQASNPISAFRLLQERGLANWKAARKYGFLRPFAWIFQLGRYIIRGSTPKGSRKSIIQGYNESRRKIALFEALGVRQYSKGIAVYRNGEYVKE